MIYDINLQKFSKPSRIIRPGRLYYALVNDTAPDAVTEELEDAIEKALNDALNKE